MFYPTDSIGIGSTLVDKSAAPSTSGYYSTHLWYLEQTEEGSSEDSAVWNVGRKLQPSALFIVHYAAAENTSAYESLDGGASSSNSWTSAGLIPRISDLILPQKVQFSS